MKNFRNIFILTFLCGVLQAQETTLAEKAEVRGGFGSPFFLYSQVENHRGGGAGGGGALIINDFFLGGFGQGESYGQHVVNALNYDLSLSQGGFWLGYVWPSRSLVHGYGSFKFGFGNAKLNRNYLAGEPSGGNDIKDKVLVMAPELGVEINIVHWARLVVSGGYRWVDGIDRLPYFTDEDFRSPVLGLTLRFGNFGHGKNTK